MNKRISMMVVSMAITGASFVAHAANPETRDVATSWKYVDYQLSNRQDKVEAGNTDRAVIYPNSTGGDTNHDGAGEIDARDIKTTLGDESTNTADTGLTTVATVNAALDNKQATLYKQPAVNIVTYTGTNTDSNSTNGYYGRGVATTTPIYDDTNNTYGNGLVRAETLNDAVADAVGNALTQVDAGWRIGDIGNALPITIYAQPSDIPTSYCYKRVQTDSSHADSQGSCSTALYSTFAKGDWAVVMPKATGITYSGTCTGNSCGKEIRGISACITTAGTYAVMAPSSLSSTLQTAYENGLSGETPSGRQCYCKVTEPHAGASTAVSPWVFADAYGSAGGCALVCAGSCAYGVRYDSRFRGAVFGGVTVQ